MTQERGTGADSSGELPAHVRRLWRLEQPRTRGPRPGLSVDAVVAAAVGVADAEGLAAVSMARVAKELGFTTMALYRHVDGKDELLQLMLDAAAGQPPPRPSGAEWRKAVLAWIAALREVHRRHPWAMEVPLTEIPAGPNQIAWMEAGLAALRDSGLTGPERAGVILSLTSYVRADVSLARQLTARQDGRPWAEVEREHGRLLAAVLDGERYPETLELVASGMFDHPGPDTDEIDTGADFGLALLLDGIDAYVGGRDGGAATERDDLGGQR